MTARTKAGLQQKERQAMKSLYRFQQNSEKEGELLQSGSPDHAPEAEIQQIREKGARVM